MKFKGKVTFVGVPKDFGKSWGIGFRIDTIDDWLNIFSTSEEGIEERTTFEKGNIVTGGYKPKDENNKYNVVESLEVIPQTVPDFEEAADIEPIDMIHSRNIMNFEKLFEKAKTTKWFEFFKDDKDSLEKIRVHLNMQARERR